MTDIPQAAIEAAAKAIWESADDEIGWDATLPLPAMSPQVEFVREEARAAIRAALPHFPGYQESIINAVERILDECSAWISDPNHDVARRIALAAGIAVMTSQFERHDRVYATGFLAGQEAAARFIEARRDSYILEHGSYDPSTGYTEFPGTGDEWIGDQDETAEAIRTLPITPLADQHPDDAAVDRFADAMKAKLAKKRAEGRGGWHDKAQCSLEHLSCLLRDHVEKGDPIDVGNFAMMLHQRGERVAPAAE